MTSTALLSPPKSSLAVPSSTSDHLPITPHILTFYITYPQPVPNHHKPQLTMLRTSVIRSSRVLATRTFSTGRISMAAGDVGGIRSGGEKAGYVNPNLTLSNKTPLHEMREHYLADALLWGFSDAFSRREKAQEEMWIKKEERAKSVCHLAMPSLT
jgi:hypothetical protein